MVTTFKITKNYKDPLEVAVKYYSILSVLNDLKLAPLEIKIIAYTAVKGNIAGRAKTHFCEVFESTKASLSKSISTLYKRKFLIKESYRKTRVNNSLFVDFNTQLVIQLNLGSE